MGLVLHHFYSIALYVQMMLSEKSKLTFISAISKESHSPAFYIGATLPPHGRNRCTESIMCFQKD